MANQARSTPWRNVHTSISRRMTNGPRRPREIARVHHQGDVSHGLSYVETVTAPIPGILPGQYYVLVRTDILDDIREVDEDNNSRVSATKVRVEGRQLTLGTAVSGQLAVGQSAYYQIEADQGDELSLALQGPAAGGSEIYVAYEVLPTRSHFDVQGTFVADSTLQARVPQAFGGTYYVLLYGQNIGPLPESYAISASLLDFGIDRITPNSGGNAGSITVQITGSRLPPYPAVSLIST